MGLVNIGEYLVLTHNGHIRVGQFSKKIVPEETNRERHLRVLQEKGPSGMGG